MERSHVESRQPGLGMLYVHELVCINRDAQTGVGKPGKPSSWSAHHQNTDLGVKAMGGAGPASQEPVPQSTSPRSPCTFHWQRGFCPRGVWKISAGWSGKWRKQLQLSQLFSRYPAHTLSLEAKTFLQSLVLVVKV